VVSQREQDQENEEILVITVPYTRRWREHIDPIVRWDFVVYGIGAKQLSSASTIQLPYGKFIKLSKGLPRYSILIPIRYSKAKKAYMAPAISRIILTLGGQDLPGDVYCDMYMWDLEPELVSALERGANLEECVKVFRDKYDLDEEGIEKARRILLKAGITEEPVRSLLLKALKEEAIGGWHLRRFYGLVVIAETLLCFSEDTSLAPINAPIISREMAAYLLDINDPSPQQYTGGFRSIRGFVGEKARRLLRHLIQQRVPWI